MCPAKKSRGPVGTQDFGLFQHELGGFVLEVWRVAVFFHDAADHDSDLGAGGFENGPVDRCVLSHAGDAFGGDDFEFVVAHCFHGAFVHGERVVEADFVVDQAQIFAALGGGLHLFGQLDPFVDHLLRGDGSVVVGGQGLLQHRVESARLNDVSLAALLDLVFEQLGEKLGGDVPVFQAAHFGEELFIEDRIEMSGRLMPAAVNTSMISSSAVMAFETRCRIAWSRSS